MENYKNIEQIDPEIATLIKEEDERQRDGLELIPSENHTSSAVLEALSTTFTDKYAEGYPGKRYYSGNAVADKLEALVQDRAKKLFGVPYVNVQPYSGSPANLAVYVATCELGDPIMGLNLLDGGHLTHGWKFSATSKFWRSIPYHMTSNGSFDFDEIKLLAILNKPKIIWCGGTAVPRTIPFAKFAEIADEVGALLVADISHIAGLIAGGVHENPAAYAHIITTTTHKTLRGPRGAIIMVTDKGLAKDSELNEKIDKAIIPGLQGGPHLNTIAGIGVALHEASMPEFKNYAQRIIQNAKALSSFLIAHGFSLVTDGTDNHLLLLDLTSTGIGRGKFFHLALEKIGLYANMNTVPGDQSSPLYPSGLRLGTPAATTRGMKEQDMEKIANWIKQVADIIQDFQMPKDKEERSTVLKKFKEKLATDSIFKGLKSEVTNFCRDFPIPGLE